MAELGWSQTYAVGVAALDDEHRELFDAVQAFELAMMRNTEAEEIRALLRNLTAATVEHFAHEEAMMRDTKYPGLTLHTVNHRHLMEKLDAFVVRFSRDGAAINQHALSFLRDWLVHHIESDDRRLGEWLNDRQPQLARSQQREQPVGQGV